MTDTPIESGTLPFSVEARLLRELGERLVRRPEIALVELIKNAYDAEATTCQVSLRGSDGIAIADNGSGMTLEQFIHGWMRIGTSAKSSEARSPRFQRPITGEKGIGRFSVRFLGQALELESVAQDASRGCTTRVSASFGWPAYDAAEDLGEVRVPYRLTQVPAGAPTGTTLTIGDVRTAAGTIDLSRIRTASIGLVSPLQSLMVGQAETQQDRDPGFRLLLEAPNLGDEPDDTASRVLTAYTLRATLRLRGKRLTVRVYRAGQSRASLDIRDSVTVSCGDLDADIRFFPRRAGAFQDIGLDGRVAYTWIRENSGVAVFDRNFHVSPYGEPGDDWLRLTRDAARNERNPRSSLAAKHFPMPEAVKTSTTENWMLRLPESAQLVGVVQVRGSRSRDEGAEGLVPAADREGFIANEAFAQLEDLVRGAVEAIAMVDRQVQKEQAEAAEKARLARMKAQAEAAVEQIQANPNIAAADKRRLVSAISQMATDAEASEAASRSRVKQLEVMSLLGVVAGFMTHEFGVALDELTQAQQALRTVSSKHPELKKVVEQLEASTTRLQEFVQYSTAYISGTVTLPDKGFPARPRVRLITKIFGKYAAERGITISIGVPTDLLAPRVPTSLYDGVLLNLLTNSLKAVTSGLQGAEPKITFRAWNEKDWHVLEVADTGIGIPQPLRERIFEPLFSTSASRHDPLGSGMGLGLALVRASVAAFGGTVAAVDAQPGFSTCIRVRLPLTPKE